jgi:hypothetical protein
MSVTFRVDPAQEMALVLIEGDISVDDIRSYRSSLAAHPDWRKGYRQLVDVRGAALGALSAEAVRSLADSAAELDPVLGAGKVAIVVSEEVHFGMARMYQAMAEGSARSVEVFRDPTPALDWLGPPTRPGDS